MLKPPFAVVFDTNAYRNLVYGLTQDEVDARIQSVNDAELSLGIQAFVNPWVLLELLSRLSDELSAGRAEIRHAIRAVWRHGAIAVQGHPVLATVADSEEQLAMTVCGVGLPAHRETQHIATSAAMRIGEAGANDSLSDLSQLLTTMQRQADQIRATFVDDLREYVVREFNPDAQDWAPLAKDPEKRERVEALLKSSASLRMLAKALIIKAHVLAHNTLPNNIPEDVVDAVLSHFRTPIEMYRHILQRLAGRTGSNMEKTKRANSIWDFNISFTVGHDQTVNHLAILLVTDDGGIHESARRAGHSDRVIRLKDYLSMLSLSFPNLGGPQPNAR